MSILNPSFRSELIDHLIYLYLDAYDLVESTVATSRIEAAISKYSDEEVLRIYLMYSNMDWESYFDVSLDVFVFTNIKHSDVDDFVIPLPIVLLINTEI